MNFNFLARSRAAFKRVVTAESLRHENSRERVNSMLAECVRISDRLAVNRLAALRAAAVQIKLHANAGECRAELLGHLEADGDGSVGHVTSLGVHLAGIECAMTENCSYTASLANASGVLDAQRASLLREIAALKSL